MKKYFKIVALLVFAAFFQSFECDGTPPLGSTNGPGPQDTGIDLSKKTYLEEPIQIPLTILIEEYNHIEKKYYGIDSAAVYFYCCDSTIYSDATGTVHFSILTDSIPYEYSYSVSKPGYKGLSGNAWDTSTTGVSNHIITSKL